MDWYSKRAMWITWSKDNLIKTRCFFLFSYSYHYCVDNVNNIGFNQIGPRNTLFGPSDIYLDWSKSSGQSGFGPGGVGGYFEIFCIHRRG